MSIVDQAIIEDMVGIIDQEFADYISMQSTEKSKRVVSMFKMQMEFPLQSGGWMLLRQAVSDCKEEWIRKSGVNARHNIARKEEVALPMSEKTTGRV
ncbi:MAG TPA: hypothetical protein P5244_05410 [Syntrophales bacterium]|nr:hypothetical protein [Syntrophales bacterium]